MKSQLRGLFCSLLLLLVLSFSTLSVLSQSDEEMKAMMAYATPGDIHKMMAKSVGAWTGAATMWMQPGAPPVNSTLEGTNEMILGGRYLQGKNTGNFMGMPFEGVSVIGYDNAKKMFVNSWIDNMGTGMMFLTGKWDNASKSITFTGSMVDPGSGKDIAVREVMTFNDDNHQTLEMYGMLNGKEFKNMEIKLTRK